MEETRAGKEARASPQEAQNRRDAYALELPRVHAKVDLPAALAHCQAWIKDHATFHQTVGILSYLDVTGEDGKAQGRPQLRVRFASV